MIDSLVATATRRRRRRAAAHPDERRSLDRPVVSVGNLSMGGSGKSPLVAHVARLLQHIGHKPAVLSRGYARPRSTDGAVVVSDGVRILAGYDIAGDEPLMLARQLPGCAVVVCPDRYLAGSLAERRLGCTVHVLDDGFQHLQLNRSLDIVILRRRDLAERVLPSGRLREPLDAIVAADAVVVDGEEGIESEAMRLGARRVFVMSRHVGPVTHEPAYAFAGIAHPEDFFDALRRAGCTLAGSARFADHHRYSAAELSRMSESAAQAGARALVTTEKDAARLPDVKLPLPVAIVSLTVSMEPANDFETLLERVSGGCVR